MDQVAQRYYDEFYCVTSQQGITGYQPVGINDMGLEGGGVFDIKQQLGAQYRWKPPHHEHSTGEAVDFRCHRDKSWSVIYHDPVIDRFMDICRNVGFNFVLREDKGSSNEHIHCGMRY